MNRTELAPISGRELDWEHLVIEAGPRGSDPRFEHLSDDDVERQVAQKRSLGT